MWSTPMHIAPASNMPFLMFVICIQLHFGCCWLSTTGSTISRYQSFPCFSPKPIQASHCCSPILTAYNLSCIQKASLSDVCSLIQNVTQNTLFRYSEGTLHSFKLNKYSVSLTLDLVNLKEPMSNKMVRPWNSDFSWFQDNFLCGSDLIWLLSLQPAPTLVPFFSLGCFLYLYGPLCLLWHLLVFTTHN